MTVTWTQSADPFFAGYQVYQSSAQGELGSLIGTNTDIADTSLAVTGLSPGMTYYFTLRVLGASGAYVESGQGSGMTAKAFWQQDWFPYVVFFAVLIAVAAIVIYVLAKRYRKRQQVT